MNPETRLCWVPLNDKLVELRQQCIREGLTPPHWDRVENSAGSGYPDLDWHWDRSGGHIELKYRADLPDDVENTPISLPTITPHQRLWWRQRWEAGGAVFVLLRLGEEYLMFPGFWAAMNLGNSTLKSLHTHCVYRAKRKDLNAAVLLGRAVR